jgi:hypothetical protein
MYYRNPCTLYLPHERKYEKKWGGGGVSSLESTASLVSTEHLLRYNSAAKHAKLVGQSTAQLLQFLVDHLGNQMILNL